MKFKNIPKRQKYLMEIEDSLRDWKSMRRIGYTSFFKKLSSQDLYMKKLMEKKVGKKVDKVRAKA